MANYSWVPTGGGAWGTTTNWSPNGIPGSALGDTADITTTLTSPVTMSFAASYNWPKTLSTDLVRVWTFGAAANNYTMTLQEASEIFVGDNGLATAYDVLWYPKMAGSFPLKITGNGTFNLAASAAGPWTVSKLVMSAAANLAGAAFTTWPSTVEFGDAANALDSAGYDSQSSSAVTVTNSIKVNAATWYVNPISTGAVTFTGTVTFSNSANGVEIMAFAANGVTLNGAIAGDGATALRCLSGMATPPRLTLGSLATIAANQITSLSLELDALFTFQSTTLLNTAWGPYEVNNSSTYPDGSTVGALTGAGRLNVVRNLQVGGSSNLSNTFSGPIMDVAGTSSTYTVTKAGTGTQTLSGAGSTAANAWAINAGILIANSAAALGASSSNKAVTVSNTGPATLRIGAAVNKTSSPLTIGGTGVVSGTALGALYSVSGTTSYTCASIALSANTTIRVDAGTFTLASAGAISGSGFALTKTGAGELVLNQTADSAYTGGTVIAEGTLTVQKSVAANGGNSPLGTNSLTMGSATSATPVTTTFKMSPAAAGQATTFAKTLVFTSASSVNATYRFETANTTTLTVSITPAISYAGAGTSTRTLELTGSATGVWDTNIAAPGGTLTTALSKTGTGTWTLNNKTYGFTGGINVTAGTLTASSVTYTAGTITVNGGTLGGTITSAGTVAISSGTVSTTAFTATTITVTGGTITGTLTATTINSSAGTFTGSDCTATSAFNITGGSTTSTTAKYRGPILLSVTAPQSFSGQIVNPTSGPPTTLTLTSPNLLIAITGNTGSNYTGETLITEGTLVRGISNQNPATAGQGYVFGQSSKVTVAGTLRTGASTTSFGRIRYKGGLTLKTGSTLAIGIN